MGVRDRRLLGLFVYLKEEFEEKGVVEVCKRLILLFLFVNFVRIFVRLLYLFRIN